MAASIAGRSTFLRTLCSKPSHLRTTSRFSASQSPMNSLLVFRCARILSRSMRYIESLSLPLSLSQSLIRYDFDGCVVVCKIAVGIGLFASCLQRHCIGLSCLQAS